MSKNLLKHTVTDLHTNDFQKYIYGIRFYNSIRLNRIIFVRSFIEFLHQCLVLKKMDKKNLYYLYMK